MVLNYILVGCPCHVLLGFWLLSCWVHFKVRPLSFWEWFCAIWYLPPGTALNLPFKCFSPKQFSASLKLCRDFQRNGSGIYCCVTHFYGSKGIFLGILQSVDLLNMMQLMHINFEQIQTGHLFFVVVAYNIFKRHNFTDQLVSW